MNRIRITLGLARARLVEFARECKGTVSVEAAVMMPFMLGLFAVTFVWFDAFRTKNSVLKATYSVADMISRETIPLSEGYFNGLNTVFRYMTNSPDPTSLRVTTVKCTKDCDNDAQRELEMCWSWASTGTSVHTDTTFEKLEEAIPLMVLGDTVVVTEGSVDYSPLFNRWMSDIKLRNTIVTRPRFAPQVALGEERCYGSGGDSGGGEDDELL